MQSEIARWNLGYVRVYTICHVSIDAPCIPTRTIGLRQQRPEANTAGQTLVMEPQTPKS